MTPRRLINKKAYDELVLLEEFCSKQDFEKIRFELGIELKFDKSEQFFIVAKPVNGIKIRIVGKDYTEISKKLMEYLSE